MADVTLTIDARGEACPVPVVRTLKALGALGGPGTVETLVDNEVAVQNLTRMGEGKGCEVLSERLGEREWRVRVTASAAVGVAGDEADAASCEAPATAQAAAPAPRDVVVAITSECMGTGDDELGRRLMASFVYSLTQLDELPSAIVLYNGGARLSCEGSPVLEDLRGLAAAGVEVMTCGTCLGFYGLTEKVAVGVVGNMYDIAGRLTRAGLVVRP